MFKPQIQREALHRFETLIKLFNHETVTVLISASCRDI